MVHGLPSWIIGGEGKEGGKERIGKGKGKEGERKGREGRTPQTKTMATALIFITLFIANTVVL